MAINVANAYIGTPPIDGGVFFAASLGTDLPKTATEELDSAFEDHGAVGEDGLAITPERTTTTEKMFGGEDFVDIQTEYAEQAVVTLLEDDNLAVIKSSFGDANVVTTEATTSEGAKKTIYHTSAPLPIKSFVLKSVSGDKSKTYVIERGRVSTVEKTPDVHSGTTKTTLTIKVFRSVKPEYKGAFVVELREDGTPADSSQAPEGA